MTCGTGGGHNAAARALEEALIARGHRAAVLNPYTLKSGRLARQIDRAYVGMAQSAPHLFGAVYALGDLYRKLPVRSPVYHVNQRMVPVLRDYLAQHPCDVILTTHLFPGEITTQMKAHGLSLPPTVFVATDYVCIPFTEELDCDAYVIPSEELAPDFVRRGLPREKLYPLGIPVSGAFQGRADRAEAARALGLDPETHYILISGGSIGAGNLLRVVRQLYRRFARTPGVRIAVICGSHRSLYQHLRRTYGDRILLLEHTGQMALWLRVCDLFLTKPGGLSSTEAAVAGTVLIHTAPIPGCEDRNLRYFVRRGMSLPGDSRRALARSLDRLEQDAARAALRENQRRIHSDAARDIARLAEDLAAAAQKSI